MHPTPERVRAGPKRPVKSTGFAQSLEIGVLRVAYIDKGAGRASPARPVDVVEALQRLEIEVIAIYEAAIHPLPLGQVRGAKP